MITSTAIRLTALTLALAGSLHAADTPPPARAKAGAVPTLDALITSLDKNKDGKITKDEATGMYAQRFDQWDGNKDGSATREEIHTFRTALGIDDNGQRAGATSAKSAPRPAAKAAVILKEPADWRLETMSVPPGFAPDVKLKGSEEIRFAPGMFDNTSTTYFTCAIAITAEGTSELGVADIKDFLEKYYRGLSNGRAKRKGTAQDVSEMVATVTPVPDTKDRYTGTMVFFDSFSDGRKVTLNLEIATFAQPEKKQSVMLLMVSPSAKDSAVWPELRAVGKKAEANAAVAK